MDWKEGSGRGNRTWGSSRQEEAGILKELTEAKGPRRVSWSHEAEKQTGSAATRSWPTHSSITSKPWAPVRGTVVWPILASHLQVTPR